MSMVRHLISWDVRRFRVMLSVWLLLVAANALHDGVWPSMAVAMEAQRTVALTGNLLGVIQLLFSMVLIAQIVQEHPLVGTTAFWMTRPIPPRALLVAKLILLAVVFIVVPAVAEIAVMVAYGVPAANVAGVAAQTLFFRTLWLCLILAFAAPTQNLAKYAFAVGGALIAAWMVLITINAVTVDRFASRPPITPAQGPHDPTPGAIGAVVTVLAAGAFLVVLYRTRNRVSAFAVGATGLVVAWAVASVWAWPLLAPRADTPSWAFDAARLQLSAMPDRVKVHVGGDWSYQPPVWTLALAPIHTSGLEPGWSVEASMREALVRMNGREPLVSRMRGPRSSPVVVDSIRQRNEVMRRVLNVGRLIDSTGSSPEDAVVMATRTDDLRQLGNASGSYEGQFLMWLTRHDVEAVLPLRVGASMRTRAYRFELDRIRLRQARISLLGRESDATSMFLRDPASRIEYYIRNPVTSEAVQAAWRPLRSGPGVSGFLRAVMDADDGPDRSGFIARAVGLEFPSAYGRDQKGIVFDETWIERGELIIVRSTDSGAVERRLAIENFPVRTQ